MCYPNKTIPRVAFTVALALTTAPLLAAATGGGGERDPWIRAAQISVDYFDIKADFEYAIAPFAPAGLASYVLQQAPHERRALVFDFGETLTRSGDEWGATLTLQFRNGWILDFSARDGRQSAFIRGNTFETVTLAGDQLFEYSADFTFEQISGEVRARYFPDIELWRTLRLFLAAGVGYTEVELTANAEFGLVEYASFTEYKSAQGVLGFGLIWPGEYKNLAFGLRLETYGGIGTQSFKTQSLSPTGGVAVQDFVEDSVYLRVLSDSRPENTLEGIGRALDRASEISIAYREFEQTLTRKSRYFFAEGQATLYANYWVDTERMSFYLFGEAGGKVRSHFDGGDATVFTGLFRGMFLKAGIGASF